MSPITDITENNASNLHLATPDGVQLPEIHAITQSVSTMRAFLTDGDMVVDPWTNAQVDVADKNDLVFAVMEKLRLDHVLVATVEVTGTATVADDATVQLVATATYGPGYEVDVTATATWESSDPTKATVAAGLVTGVAAGSTNIKATFGGVESDNFAVTVTS